MRQAVESSPRPQRPSMFCAPGDAEVDVLADSDGQFSSAMLTKQFLFKGKEHKIQQEPKGINLFFLFHLCFAKNTNLNTFRWIHVWYLHLLYDFSWNLQEVKGNLHFKATPCLSLQLDAGGFPDPAHQGYLQPQMEIIIMYQPEIFGHPWLVDPNGNHHGWKNPHSGFRIIPS